MKSPSNLVSRPARSGASAFTLVEILTVITIIAVLMAMLFPAIGGIKESARRSQAKNDCQALVTACRAYFTDYGKYPTNPQQMQGGAYDTCYGDPNGTYSSADLLNILRAIPDDGFNKENALNPRQTIYFTGAVAKDAAKPKGGITSQEVQGPAGKIKKGGYVDPWGDEYVVFLDGDYDHVNIGPGWFYWGEQNTYRSGIIAASLGKDLAWGTKGNGKFTGSDDVTTW